MSTHIFNQIICKTNITSTHKHHINKHTNMLSTKNKTKERCPYLGKLPLTFLAKFYNSRYLRVKQRTINKILIVYPNETKLALKNLEGSKVLSNTLT